MKIWMICLSGEWNIRPRSRRSGQTAFNIRLWNEMSRAYGCQDSGWLTIDPHDYTGKHIWSEKLNRQRGVDWRVTGRQAGGRRAKQCMVARWEIPFDPICPDKIILDDIRLYWSSIIIIKLKIQTMNNTIRLNWSRTVRYWSKKKAWKNWVGYGLGHCHQICQYDCGVKILERFTFSSVDQLIPGWSNLNYIWFGIYEYLEEKRGHLRCTNWKLYIDRMIKGKQLNCKRNRLYRIYMAAFCIIDIQVTCDISVL